MAGIIERYVNWLARPPTPEEDAAREFRVSFWSAIITGVKNDDFDPLRDLVSAAAAAVRTNDLAPLREINSEIWPDDMDWRLVYRRSKQHQRGPSAQVLDDWATGKQLPKELVLFFGYLEVSWREGELLRQRGEPKLKRGELGKLVATVAKELLLEDQRITEQDLDDAVREQRTSFRSWREKILALMEDDGSWRMEDGDHTPHH